MLRSLADDFPLLLSAIALILFVIGERRVVRMRRRPRDRAARRRAWSFYAGLLTIALALNGPLDRDAQTLFWVHMVQHVLLLTVAAPLIVLGAPWMSIWRPLPLGFRRGVAGGLARRRWSAPLRVTGRALGRPRGAFLAFNVNLVGWHIPALFDLTLRNVWIHALEHTTFLGFGILLWSQVLSSPPLKLRLSSIHRVYYIVASSAVSWGLSLVLAFAGSPLYPTYAHLAYRPGAISALTDQQLAAGIMLVPGSLTMTIFVFVELYRWIGGLAEDSPSLPLAAGTPRT